ncbi:MAG TPA: hypothetical protein DGR97_05225, partial [Gammaproteobacteria bacterium]|nr:hypothetical protein [Gammaproteobacteria bacterium]
MSEPQETLKPPPPIENEHMQSDSTPSIDFDGREVCLTVSDLNLYYSENQALNGINMTIPEKMVTSFIGPSGCGKSTLLSITAGLIGPDTGMIRWNG